jgi:hypothetical protein
MDAYIVISKAVGPGPAVTVHKAMPAQDALVVVDAALDGARHVEVVDASGAVVSIASLRKEAAGVAD